MHKSLTPAPSPIFIGGHVSVAGGLHKSIERGEHEEFNVIQVFVTSPRSFRITQYTEEQVDHFIELKRNSSIQKVFLHAIYLVNLASENADLREKSIESLVHYLEMGERIGAEGTIVHVGNKSGEQSFEVVFRSVEEVLKRTEKSAPNQKFIVEGMASPKRIGGTLQDLVAFSQHFSGERVTFCLDTQHMYAAGVDVADSIAVQGFMDTFDAEIGLGRLSAFHVNDSKTALGSYHDRHENIGQGAIGMEGFCNFFMVPSLRMVPLILETPGFGSDGPDKQNKDLLLQAITSGKCR